MKIAIIDYEMGNLFSVHHACKFIGLNSFVTSDRKKILNSDAAILPGVGAFGRAMKYLAQLDLIETIKMFIQTGKPFMGVCLGMQLLFSESEEFGYTKGLDIIKGKVQKFPDKDKTGGIVKVPQIGWNQILKTSNNRADSPLNNICNGEFMYFVHSYYVHSMEQTFTTTTTEYAGIEYCSSLLKDNVFATQFHPEKSAKQGIHIYENWAKVIENS